MEHITLGQIVGAISILSIIIGFVVTIHNLIKKAVTDKIDRNAEDIKELKNKVAVLEKETDDSKEERLILLQGLLACLKGLKEQGCDGAVTTSIEEIEKYLMKKSHD